MDMLPSEIIQYILNFLQLLDLIRCSQVSKKWNLLIKDAPEYEYMYMPKVVKIDMVIGLQKRKRMVYLCDYCLEWGVSSFRHSACKKCGRLHCHEAHANKEYCIKCAHDFNLTRCNKPWKKCKLTINSHGCLDAGCQKCNLQTTDYYQYNSTFNKVCHECFNSLELNMLASMFSSP